MTETKKKRPATKAAKPKQGAQPAMQKNTQSDIVVTEATIADLIPDDKNLNKGTQFGQHLIEKSLRELGAGRSLLLDKNNRIIAGNKTTENAAAIDLNDVIIVESDGTKLVAVKRTDIDLDSERGRKLALADNATSAANLEWDEEQMAALQAKLDNFDPGEWGVEFETQDNKDYHAEEDDFDENTDKVETRCKAGDIWQLGEHRLMCGDSTDAGSVDLLMNGAKADMCFTDPPYGVSYADKNRFLNTISFGHRIQKPIANDHETPKDMYSFWLNVFNIIGEYTADCMAYYITAPQGGELLLLLQAIQESKTLALKHMLIWNKNNHVLGRCDYNYKHEPIIYGWKKNGTHHFVGGSNFKTSVWDIPKPIKSDLHPTMKPVELVSACLLDNSNKGQSVLDLFGGSGTTMIAAEQLGRKCYMMELDPHYCDIIIARWEKLTNGKAHKIN